MGKSLTLTLNDNNKSLTDNKSLKIKDVKSLQFKDMMKSNTKRTVQPQSNVDNEELMKQIEKLNIENDLLRTKNDLSQNVTTLNETISKIVLQNALKKNRKKKKMKDGNVTGKIEKELNIFESKLIQITMALN